MPIKPEEIKRVKAIGFLHNRGTEEFSARVITENGTLTTTQLCNLSEAAEKFGSGRVAFTSRMTVELPGIAFDSIEPFREYIAKEGMVTGGTGAKVRPVIACKGTTCVYGLYDTQSAAAEVHKRFFEGYGNVVFPHKFKIAVGGCPNNCVKPDLNDVGIVGQRPPRIHLDSCRSCGKCGVELNCPMSAARKNGQIAIDPEACNYCGRCYKRCPFGAVTHDEQLFKVYIGGRWGKKIRHGNALSRLFTYEEALDMIEKAILLFKKEGKCGERFGETIDRLGIQRVEELLFSAELLNQRAEILNQE